MTITVTGLTKDRMLQIEAASVVGGVVDGAGHLILERHDGGDIDAGYVIGPDGPPFVNGVDTVSAQTIGGAKKFTSPVLFPTGTAALPGISIDGDPNSGIYSSGADEISIATNGVKKFTVDQNGKFVFIRPAAGTTIEITKETAGMHTGSLRIGRTTPATDHQSIVFVNGLAYNFVIGRSANTDNLEFGYDGGGGFVKTLSITPGGSVITNGTVHINTNGAGINAYGLEVFESPNPGYAIIYGHGQWGVGAGGDYLKFSNTDGMVFLVTSNGELQWGPGANIAGVFVANATAGGGQATPATVAGFMRINVNGVARKVAYYAD